MRKLILIFFSLFTVTLYSQNITITSEQLKTANLIFVEHQKLSKTVPLLEQQITNLELINRSWERTDSIRQIQINKIVEEKNKSIDNLKKTLKTKQNIIKYGALSSVAIILCLLIN